MELWRRLNVMELCRRLNEVSICTVPHRGGGLSETAGELGCSVYAGLYAKDLASLCHYDPLEGTPMDPLYR